MGITFDYVTKEYIQDLYNNGIISSSYWVGSELDIDRTFLIIEYPLQLGLVQLSFSEYKNHKKIANVDMIELFSSCRNRGIGERVIKSIFSTFNIVTLFGESLPSAIPFWYNLGANFEMSDKKLNKCIDYSYSACFKLTKQALNKG